MRVVGVFVFSLLFLSQIPAAEVTTVNGKNVQIKIGADDFLEPKEKYLLINEQNKRVGIVTIVSVAETEGQTLLLKGVAKPGYKLQLWTPPQAAQPASSKRTTISKNNIGIFVDVMMNQTALTFGTTTFSMKGQSVGFAVTYQSHLTAEAKMRYGLGYRSFAVKTSDPLCPQDTCDLSVSYLSAGARLDYFLNESLFVGAGFEYLHPLSKSSSILNADQIQGNSVATVAFGAIVNSQIPIALTYNHFLQNKDAPSSFISIQLGYLIPSF